MNNTFIIIAGDTTNFKTLCQYRSVGNTIYNLNMHMVCCADLYSYLHGFCWIHIHHKMWDEITYQFSNFNGAIVEVWEWRHYVFMLSVCPSEMIKTIFPPISRSVGLSGQSWPFFCPSVRLSVRRIFRAFSDKCVKGMVWNVAVRFVDFPIFGFRFNETGQNLRFQRIAPWKHMRNGLQVSMLMYPGLHVSRTD